MVSDWETKELIQGFIDQQVIGRGLDERTEKAYRLDLEHFYRWLEDMETAGTPIQSQDKEIREYLEYLAIERGLRPSTIARRSRVIGYYLEYLTGRGILSGGPSVRPSFYLKFLSTRSIVPGPLRSDTASLGPASLLPDTLLADPLLSPAHRLPDPGPKTIHGQEKTAEGMSQALSKGEIDAIFQALQREYAKLESDFRRRICLRDLVMLGLLFYHGIEVSELLRIQLLDYDRKSGVLSIRRKRGRAEPVYLYSRALREWMSGWLKEHAHFEREEEYRDCMFLSKLGKPLSMKMVINIFDKYRVMAGIETAYTPKDLKNSMERYARELVVERCS